MKEWFASVIHVQRSQCAVNGEIVGCAQEEKDGECNHENCAKLKEQWEVCTNGCQFCCDQFARFHSTGVSRSVGSKPFLASQKPKPLHCTAETQSSAHLIVRQWYLRARPVPNRPATAVHPFGGTTSLTLPSKGHSVLSPKCVEQSSDRMRSPSRKENAHGSHWSTDSVGDVDG
jgi:hypothetical protein